VGIDVQFCFTDSFGPLKLTNLVGWGFTNNPFYEGKHGNPFVLCNQHNRTRFHHHAFCSILLENSKPDGKPIKRIVDATVGPHIGNESSEAYLEHSFEKLKPKKKVNMPTNATGMRAVRKKIKEYCVVCHGRTLELAIFVNDKEQDKPD
jgi:hypothetical protein